MKLSEIAKELEKLSVEELETLFFSYEEYEETPVGIDEFINSKEFLGESFPEGFYPYWMKELREIYPSPVYSPYWLIVLRGSIGRGKTTLANVIIAYEIHKLLCLINPQKKLDVAKHTRIVFMIMNMTLTLASSVVWDQLNQFFTNSPYFSARIDLNRKLKSKGTLFPKRIDIGIGSRIQHGMGQAVFSSLIDEAAFDVINNQVLKTFENLIARMQSRFMLKGGGVPGKIIVASSETEKGSALNKIVEDYRGKPGVYINAGPLWEIRPDKYCGETFPVFVGTDARQPEIIGENNKELLTIEAANIENVPIEHKDRFDVDIYESLRNLAGRSITSSYKFIGLRDRLTNILTVNSIFPDTLRLDFDNKEDNIQKHLKLKDYFVVPVQALSPRYLHIDIGISGDRLGIACGVITSFEERSFRDNVTLDIKYETSPKIQIEWCIGIEAIHGKQIPLYKVREFIIWMTRQGYRIGKITLDGYQSTDMIQLLKVNNYNAGLLSVDKTTLPYISLREITYDNRLLLPKNEILKREMFELEMNAKGDMVDHPEKNTDGTKGSKDIADSVCGVVYNLIQDANKYRTVSSVIKTGVMTKTDQNIMNQFGEAWKNAKK